MSLWRRPKGKSLNLKKSRDWVFPDPYNESLTLSRAVLLCHSDSSQTLKIFYGTALYLTYFIS